MVLCSNFLGKLLFYAPEHQEEAQHVYGKSHAPGDGIGHIQAFQRAYLTENCKDPDNAYTAGTQQTDSGGHPGPAQAAHTAAADLHQTAEEIRYRQKAHTGQTHPDHLCLQALTIRAINGQQRLTLLLFTYEKTDSY